MSKLARYGPFSTATRARCQVVTLLLSSPLPFTPLFFSSSLLPLRRPFNLPTPSPGKSQRRRPLCLCSYSKLLCRTKRGTIFTARMCCAHTLSFSSFCSTSPLLTALIGRTAAMGKKKVTEAKVVEEVSLGPQVRNERTPRKSKKGPPCAFEGRGKLSQPISAEDTLKL